MTPEEIAALQKENTDLKAELSTAEGVIEEQNKEIDRLKNGSKVSKPQVKINKKDYEVNFGVRKNGKVISPEEIAADPKFAAELLKIGSTALSVVTEG